MSMRNLIWLFIPVSLITVGVLHYNRWRGFLTLGIIGAVWLFLSLTLSVSTHHHAYAQIQAIESARSAYLTQTATPESERYAIALWVSVKFLNWILICLQKWQSQYFLNISSTQPVLRNHLRNI